MHVNEEKIILLCARI